MSEAVGVHEVEAKGGSGLQQKFRTALSEIELWLQAHAGGYPVISGGQSYPVAIRWISSGYPVGYPVVIRSVSTGGG